MKEKKKTKIPHSKSHKARGKFATAKKKVRQKPDEISIFPSVIEEVRYDNVLPTDKLQQRVLGGRLRQEELTTELRAISDQANRESLMQMRRLFHVATILARAELLFRQQHLAKFEGEEGRYDDLTIIERAKMFLEAERDRLQAEERAREITMTEGEKLEQPNEDLKLIGQKVVATIGAEEYVRYHAKY